MSANQTQVGGTHYRNSFQHWDLAAEANLGYFEGQITKYVTRHRHKKGAEDLQKALHFVNKLYELASDGKSPQHGRIQPARMYEYAEANNLTYEEYPIVLAVVHWDNLNDLEVIRRMVVALRLRCYPEEPTGAYVNQG